MREVTRFVVVFPTRLMAKSYDEKKALMDALRREYPHYLFEAMEAFEGGGADDDDFIIIPITGEIGEGADPDEIFLCRPLDPMVIPELVRAIARCETAPALTH